jgi:hypothetical protein
MYKRKQATLYGVGCSALKKNEIVRKGGGEGVKEEV